jgi:hypothetical protein
MKFNIFRNINGNFDLARIVGLKASLVYPAPFIWNAVRHGTVPDPASFGTGYALVLAAIGALIGGKELAVAKANQTNAQTAAIQQSPSEEK